MCGPCTDQYISIQPDVTVQIQGDIDIQRALATIKKWPRSSDTALKTRQQALAMIEHEMLVTPVYRYRFLPLQFTQGEMLHLGHATVRVPTFAAVSSQLTGVAVAACTLGPDFEARVSVLCSKRKLSLALALDQIGNELLFYTARRVLLLIRNEARRSGLSAGDPLSPGGNSIAFDQQAAIIDMMDGEGLGITVTGQGMLLPVKSRTMLVGIGTNLSAQPIRRRCDNCSSRELCCYRTR